MNEWCTGSAAHFKPSDVFIISVFVIFIDSNFNILQYCVPLFNLLPLGGDIVRLSEQ